MPGNYVIIGAGPAGVYAAEAVRASDPSGNITILTDEPHPFYSRPGIAYLLIDMISPQQLIARRPEHWQTMRIDLVTGARVVRILPAQQAVILSDGRSLPYDRLLIAAGAGAVPPHSFPGGDLDGVVTFDTLEDARDLLRRARTARGAVVVGGGITAMEVAEGLAHQGVETHYLLRKNTLWSNLLNQTESGLIERQIRAHGVQIHFYEEIASIHGQGGRVTGVALKSGASLDVDLVAVCIGVRPNLGLVEGTGIAVERGILVDEHLRTSIPGIYAAGDCAQIYDRWSGQYRLDSLWPTAIESGRMAGLNMARPDAPPYVKRVSFNAALLFGVHMTAMGQVGANLREGTDDEAAEEELEYISRGSSEVWTASPGGGYSSAWAQNGPSTQRVILKDNHIVGALLLGNQDLADPLRDLIEQEVDITPERQMLLAGGARLEDAVVKAWHRWQKHRQATPA
jgi:NAD(P)H-nitrite reductase large subunit